MEEIARVDKLDGEYAVVKISKKDECSKCGMCAFPKNASEIELRATNKVNAKVGDNVIIRRSEENGKFLGALLVFFVPLILIGLAVLIERLFIKNEIFMLVLSLAFIVAWFIILSIIDKKIRKNEKFICEIISVVNSEQVIKEKDR